jgi:hypothetical protein
MFNRYLALLGLFIYLWSGHASSMVSDLPIKKEGGV